MTCPWEVLTAPMAGLLSSRQRFGEMGLTLCIEHFMRATHRNLWHIQAAKHKAAELIWRHSSPAEHEASSRGVLLVLGCGLCSCAGCCRPHDPERLRDVSLCEMTSHMAATHFCNVSHIVPAILIFPLG